MIPKNLCLVSICVILAWLACGESAVAEDATAGRDAVVKADVLRVRSAPSTDAEILAKIPQNATVHIVEAPPSMAPWVRIRIPSSDGTGWVHGEYLVDVGQTETGKKTGNGIQFARVSVWPGEPDNSDWEVVPEESGGKPFYGVHGKSAEGTRFTVLVRNHARSLSAVAGKTISVEFVEETDLLPVTEIIFDDANVLTGDELFLAVAGRAEDYEPIRLTEIGDQSRIDALEKQVTRDFPTFTVMSYNYENSAFSSNDTKSSARSLSLFEAPAWLMKYATPGTHSNPAEEEDFCKSLVLLWKGAPIDCSTDCGEGIEFFRIGKRVFYWKNFKSCDSGEGYVEVCELDPESGQATSVYANGDYST